MWVLVQWKKQRTVTIMEETEEMIGKEEEEELDINYNGRTYRAILKRRSEDKSFLNCLNVSKDGKVTSKKLNPGKKERDPNALIKKKHAAEGQLELNKKISNLPRLSISKSRQIQPALVQNNNSGQSDKTLVPRQSILKRKTDDHAAPINVHSDVKFKKTSLTNKEDSKNDSTSEKATSDEDASFSKKKKLKKDEINDSRQTILKEKPRSKLLEETEFRKDEQKLHGELTDNDSENDSTSSQDVSLLSKKKKKLKHKSKKDKLSDSGSNSQKKNVENEKSVLDNKQTVASDFDQSKSKSIAGEDIEDSENKPSVEEILQSPKKTISNKSSKSGRVLDSRQSILKGKPRSKLLEDSEFREDGQELNEELSDKYSENDSTSSQDVSLLSKKKKKLKHKSKKDKLSDSGSNSQKKNVENEKSVLGNKQTFASDFDQSKSKSIAGEDIEDSENKPSVEEILQSPKKTISNKSSKSGRVLGKN
ncbi:glutamic acid-rich protein-like [Leptopilina heterotoma]|uniref:glutamic acid-rich protein-like n=1 Tax=Leptopilina heterotoma TaxID=63436 RepID=UPI001CAA3992|nr:glutamic acid-rich protein-like [Leptopilina heterotoma]